MIGRNSQQRRDAGGPVSRGGGGRGPKVISIPLSTGREAKLKTTENAWKPSAKDKKSIDSKAETDVVVKLMRGILNKITPEKFDKLVGSVKVLPIDTTERLSAVIDLIFETAVKEQRYLSSYAKMCKVLSLMSVRGNENESSNSGKSEVKFRNLIINKCQKEFEKDNTEDFRTESMKEVEACKDPQKKIELLGKLDYEETKMRKRSVGNIRFIGELYKLRMLTSPIMMRIIGTLLERGDEESLECLCKLLTTIGQILEIHCGTQAKAMSDLDKYFKTMEKIVGERRTTNRVMFLLIDVFDLRQNHWVPRREDNKPKTKAQVREEMKREEVEQQIALATNSNRRDDRYRDRERDRRRNRDQRAPQSGDDGWNTVANTKGRTSFDYTQLKNTFNRPGTGDKEISLRGTGFSSWARASSSGGLKDHDEGKQQESNMFNVLMDSRRGSALPVDNRRAANTIGGPRLAPGGGPTRQGGFGSKSMPQPSNDKESAISAVKKFVATDRSKSSSRPESRDNSVPRESEALKVHPPMDSDRAEKLTIAIIEVYTHNYDPVVVKLMRGILDKLTPEKFDELVGSVKVLPINTTESLSAVIDLIFEKAVEEQSFSSKYAKMCQVLSLMSVRGNENESSNSGKSEVKFRNLIINKCQKEFEKDNTEDFRTESMKEVEACKDPQKKIELLAKLDYEETKMRKRSVGNIRFIGELYKLRMLTSPIMMRIIGTLLERGDEESLECLCKLLTTIGQILEIHCGTQAKAMSDLDKYFKTMEKIVGERRTTNRVRFLLIDVFDLRQNHWVPRREDNKPKTKAQVREEMKREEVEQQIALATNSNRRDDRYRDRERDRRRNRDHRAPQSGDDGWNTVANTKGRTSFDYTQLKNTFNRPGTGDQEISLRGTGFSSWARASSSGGLKDHDEGKQQESNMFNVLMDSRRGSALPVDNRRAANTIGGPRLAPGGGPTRQGGFGSKSMPPPSNDKESAISAVKKFVATDRSKSSSRPESRDNSVPRESEALKVHPPMDSDRAEKLTIAIIEEYTHNCDPDEAKLCIKEKFASSTIMHFVQFSVEWVLDRDSKKRRMVGQLFHDLIVENLLPFDQLIEGSHEILSMTEDYEIDIPKVCNYLGEIFAPCLNDNAVTLKRLLDLTKAVGSNKKANVFACIVSQAAQIMGPNKVADIWNSSGLKWSDIVPSNTDGVDDFLKNYRVEFTVDRSKSSSQSVWNPQKVEAEFLELFKRASNDEMFGWIDANIGNDVKSSKFIRALVTALVESQATTSNDGSSIRVADDFERKMKTRLAVVLKYVDSNEVLEMQCIYALQALSVKHQHPPGVLEKCFNAFYDFEVVSEEAFEEWSKSDDPEEQEGKGVCVNSVKNFIRWLREAEVEETDSHA
ncbi:hypothetical protein Pcinc_025358 [Petrolisthes cinctipes]|uniref:Uncharacterized protein n=1 Tax=Petrolisthes cinctipes TaxID=88211 RepID=A0AAE1F837_PETCI|nr:hypothetical protein Pcinc_025358 [Petrolisthes cinctipes]